ncbi:uracil-DNA glycosylase family protein [Parerythrobacter aestuarii]|uniref:hypothetical protein n=1 Tax=Parerythrobacter aestuarii TaxID=3020909 RepID=UPI0024DEA155|nr:hypothetical protein [Parerythrobacter aestuarii]
MTAQSPLISADEIAGAIEWWRLAGIGTDALDEPSGWLDVETAPATADATTAPAPAPPPKPAPPPPRSIGAEIEGLAKVPGKPGDWPDELATFQRWWFEDENFAPTGAFPRIAPRGAVNAPLMVVVGEPEETDSDRLLGGPQGQVLTGFLRAAGLAVDSIYFASVLPRHTLRPDWGEVAGAGYGQLLAHHIGLVAPQRLIVFGRDILALIPHESAQDPASLRVFNHDGRSIPLLPTRDLANLARRGGFRSQFWRQWLDFSDG